MRRLPTEVLRLLSILVLVTSGAHAQHSVAQVPGADQIVDASGFRGSTLIYDAQHDSYLAAYPDITAQRFIPASTFKIFSSLVALETGVVAGKDSVIEWDGTVRSRQSINRDLDLQTAFRLSALPHYQEVVRRIGAQRMQDFIDRVGYGNRDLSGGIDKFWLTGGLRISPQEQVDFLMRLVRGDLPFSLETMSTVKELMVHEEGQGFVIRAKTGWAIPGNTHHIGWWVGWVERGTDVYAFATVLQSTSPGDTFGPSRLSVTRQILERVGALGAGESGQSPP